MLDIKIGMSKDEVRQTLGPPGEEVDLNAQLRKVGDVEKPSPWLEIWQYDDFPDDGASTSVSFKDGQVWMVTKGDKD